MVSAHAIVPTAMASRYLMQLCKHFAHKISVDYNAERGRADFPWGICHLTADAGTLTIQCEAPTDEELERVKFVLTDHVQRFGWKEKIEVTWIPG